MKRLMWVIFLLCNIQFAWANSASESLIAKLNYTKTFSSQFDQKVLDEHGRVLQHSTGEMQYSKNPALFYWNVLSPEAQKMWFRDNQFIVLDLELSQATIKKMSSQKDPSMLPVLLLTGDSSKALKNFSVEWVSHKYILKPLAHDDNALLKRVVLAIDEKSNAVQEIQYQTSLGQMTKITFIGAKVNKPLNTQLFYQPLSKNIDVIVE